MKAIEIYSKINEIVQSEDPIEASVALEFIQREVNNRRYASEVAAKSALCANNGLIGGQVYDPEARAMAMVRQVVREELQAANNPAPLEKEAA